MHTWPSVFVTLYVELRVVVAVTQRQQSNFIADVSTIHLELRFISGS